MKDVKGSAQILPGMATITEPSGRVVAAVTATLEALAALDLLEPRHAGPAQLALELALAVEHGISSRRASATALAARELREMLAQLPEPPEQPTDADPFMQFMTELEAAGK